MDLDQYLIVCRGGFRQLCEMENLGRAIPLIYDRLHESLSGADVIKSFSACLKAGSQRRAGAAHVRSGQRLVAERLCEL
jgi:hypothetical protein